VREGRHTDRSRIALSALVMLTLATTAHGADQLTPGKKLEVRALGSKQSVRFSSKGRFTLPVPGSADDPTRAGATFQLVNPTTSESFTFTLPNRRWSVSLKGRAYRYRDFALSEPDRVLSAFLGGGALKVVAKKAGITLDEPAQGALAIVLASGAVRYCARFDDGSIVKDVPGRFTAKNAVAPTACYGLVTTTTTSSSTLPPVTTTTATGSTTTTMTTLPPCGGGFQTCAGSCPMGFSCRGSLTFPCACR
jgi:hypothetical protein